MGSTDPCSHLCGWSPRVLTLNFLGVDMSRNNPMITFQTLSTKAKGRNTFPLSTIIAATKEGPSTIVLSWVPNRSSVYPIVVLSVDGKATIVAEDIYPPQVRWLGKCIERYEIVSALEDYCWRVKRPPPVRNASGWINYEPENRILVPVAKGDVYDQDAHHLMAIHRNNF